MSAKIGHHVRRINGVKKLWLISRPYSGNHFDEPRKITRALTHYRRRHCKDVNRAHFQCVLRQAKIHSNNCKRKKEKQWRRASYSVFKCMKRQILHAQLVKKFLTFYGTRRFIIFQKSPPLLNRVLNQSTFTTISV